MLRQEMSSASISMFLITLSRRSTLKDWQYARPWDGKLRPHLADVDFRVERMPRRFLERRSRAGSPTADSGWARVTEVLGVVDLWQCSSWAAVRTLPRIGA